MNTSETPPDGVWFRSSPHTGDTDKVTGHGVYMGEQVQLRCYAWGDVIGPYNDSLWYYVNNVSRPTNAGVPNVGYLNAHYINDGMLANQVDEELGECGAPPPPPPTTAPQLPPPSAGGSVSLAQGAAAPSGYRYAITLSGFAAGASVSISCRDTADRGGFYTFSLSVDARLWERVQTSSYCYSNDGPDHWVVANGSIESNHVSWGPTLSPRGGGGSVVSPGSGATGGPAPTSGSPLRVCRSFTGVASPQQPPQ